MKGQTKQIIVAALSVLAASLPLASMAQGPGPEEAEMLQSKDRGLFIEQPSYVRKSVDKAVREEASMAPVKKKIDAAPKAAVTVKKTVTVEKAARVEKPAVAHTVVKKTVKTAVLPVKNKPKSSGAVQIVKHPTFVGEPAANASSDDAIITAWLNKSGSTPRYRDGEKMEINVKASRDCNVTIYDYDGKGKLTQIFPNNYQQSAMVRSGQTVTIGGADSEFEYQLSVDPGVQKVNERIFVFAYPVAEAPLSIAMNSTPNSAFRSAEMTPEAYRKMVNESRVFFSREVKIMPRDKNNVQPVAQETGAAPNKIELSLIIEK